MHSWLKQQKMQQRPARLKKGSASAPSPHEIMAATSGKGLPSLVPLGDPRSIAGSVASALGSAPATPLGAAILGGGDAD
eukprot:11828401-Alexandrium_andersonii.AAC.1